MTWMCRQFTTSCWILTSHQTLSRMWMWKQSPAQAAVEMLTVWAPLHADIMSSRHAEWADAKLWLQLPFPLTGAESVEICWKCCGAVRTQHLSGCLLPNIFVIKDCFAALNHTEGLFSQHCPDQQCFALMLTDCISLKYDEYCTTLINLVLIGNWAWLLWLFGALWIVIFSCVLWS